MLAKTRNNSHTLLEKVYIGKITLKSNLQQWVDEDSVAQIVNWSLIFIDYNHHLKEREK